MKKFLTWIILICAFFIILNIPVTIKQGVNYKVHQIQMPLYLKLLDFYDRHFNYQLLVRRILDNEKDPEARVMKLFQWSVANIQHNPEGFPVIDDHVWHILIRGYGTDDQASDAFTTLCNYAGTEAFYANVDSIDTIGRKPFSFVKIREKWYVFDPYNGVYFTNNSGALINIQELKNNHYTIKALIENRREINYSNFFKNFPPPEKIGLTRANIQSPLNRLLFEIKKRLAWQ